MNVSVQVRDGHVTHAIVRRDRHGEYIRLECACGFWASVQPEHEVIVYALHLTDPAAVPAVLATLYQNAVQAVASTPLGPQQ